MLRFDTDVHSQKLVLKVVRKAGLFYRGRLNPSSVRYVPYWYRSVVPYVYVMYRLPHFLPHAFPIHRRVSSRGIQYPAYEPPIHPSALQFTSGGKAHGRKCRAYALQDGEGEGVQLLPLLGLVEVGPSLWVVRFLCVLRWDRSGFLWWIDRVDVGCGAAGGMLVGSSAESEKAALAFLPSVPDPRPCP